MEKHCLVLSLAVKKSLIRIKKTLLMPEEEMELYDKQGKVCDFVDELV